MSVLDAAYHLVRNYPGEAASLAPRLGKSQTTLCHEVRPPQGSTAKLGLKTAVDMTVLSGDLRVLNAFAAEAGCVVLKLPENLDPGKNVANQTAQLAHEFAELMSEIAGSATDRVISDNELRRLRNSWSELVAVGQHLMASFEAASKNNEQI